MRPASTNNTGNEKYSIFSYFRIILTVRAIKGHDLYDDYYTSEKIREFQQLITQAHVSDLNNFFAELFRKKYTFNSTAPFSNATTLFFHALVDLKIWNLLFPELNTINPETMKTEIISATAFATREKRKNFTSNDEALRYFYYHIFKFAHNKALKTNALFLEITTRSLQTSPPQNTEDKQVGLENVPLDMQAYLATYNTMLQTQQLDQIQFDAWYNNLLSHMAIVFTPNAISPSHSVTTTVSEQSTPDAESLTSSPSTVMSPTESQGTTASVSPSEQNPTTPSSPSVSHSHFSEQQKLWHPIPTRKAHPFVVTRNTINASPLQEWSNRAASPEWRNGFKSIESSVTASRDPNVDQEEKRSFTPK